MIKNQPDISTCSEGYKIVIPQYTCTVAILVITRVLSFASDLDNNYSITNTEHSLRHSTTITK